jgi:hypothetical protein
MGDSTKTKEKVVKVPKYIPEPVPEPVDNTEYLDFTEENNQESIYDNFGTKPIQPEQSQPESLHYLGHTKMSAVQRSNRGIVKPKRN